MTARMAAPAQPASSPRPVTSPAEARELLAHYDEVLDRLLPVIAEETALVRAGRLREAAKLAGDKSALAQLYLTDTARLQASKSFLAQALPAAIERLRTRHQDFCALLQTNLTVLATAHAVSEGIMRSVSQDVTRKASLQTYGASGRHNAPPPRSSQPLTVSRLL